MIMDGGVSAAGTADIVGSADVSFGGASAWGVAIYSGGSSATGGDGGFGGGFSDGFMGGLTAVTMDGGLVGGGEAAVTIDYVTFGGLDGSGDSGVTAIYTAADATTGASAAGSALVSTADSFSFVSVGDLVLVAGAASSGITAVSPSPSGGVVLTTPGDVVTGRSFNKLTEFTWNVQGSISGEFEFQWNLGRLKLYWYKVVSKPLDEIGCTTPCCQRITANIAARSLTELCGKLKKRKYKFPIDTVERFSRPASNADAAEAEAAGADFTCNTLVPVEVCKIPACADYCVDQDLKTTIGFRSFVQVNAFLDYTASGSAFVAGAAAATYFRDVPAFTWEATGGPSIDAGSDYTPSHLAMRGGVGAGGAAATASSSWYYVGGVWPNTTAPRYATASDSLSLSFGDQPWMLHERVRFNDNLFCQTDISYGKKSHRLLAEGFGLDVPDWGSVLGITVKVDRVATQTGVRDEEVYLTLDGVPFSDNLADLGNDWPLIVTEKRYGASGTGTNDRPLWRDPDGDHYPGPFAPADLRNSRFGVALRVRARTPLAAQIARINYVTVQVFYEDAAGSIVRFSGTARATSPGYSYAPAGKIVPDSRAVYGLGYRYRPNGLGPAALAAVQIGGHSPLGIFETGTGGTGAGGEALVTPYFETATGGAGAGGVATVVPYFEVVEGGVGVGGAALRSNHIKYVGDGPVTLGSATYTPERRLSFGATGGPVLGSTVRVRSNFWRWVSDGNAVFIFGSADQRPSDIGTPVQTVGFGMSLLQFSPSFVAEATPGVAAALSATVRRCGCVNLPLTIELSHNIATNNSFAKFLARNNYTIPRIMKLRYNTPNDSWQSNLHYRGQSAEASVPEAWDLVFELQCTDIVGGSELGRSIWRIAVQITRKNLMTRESLETRVIVAVLPDLLCGSTAAELNFAVAYDTQSDVAVITPGATVYQSTIYDNVGLFKNPAWIAAPELDLRVSQSGSTRTSQRVDLTDAVLVD
jgi:hypothetical protein